MLFRLAGIEPESVVDGPGIRMAVFFQGCAHECPGCHNKSTWDFNGGDICTVQEILDKYDKNSLLSGITLTGGDPLYQPFPALELSLGIHDRGGNVWLYTGFEIKKELITSKIVRDLLMNVDIVVDGPFILAERDLSLEFRGSRNQRLLSHDDILRIMEG